jgi:hypothetical protein
MIGTRLLALGAAFGLALLSTIGASANVALVQVSSDPFTNTTSQHRTEVEPDTFSAGSTEVSTFQVGRFTDGGASDIGWATTTNSGGTWTHGFLPGITKYLGAGPYDRVSDPSVAYDARHNVWLISSLPILETPSIHGPAVIVSRSTDGGLTWGNPVTIATASDTDKNWTVCDNTPSSPFYGNCYTEWDNHGAGNLIQMNTSSDGGLTWGPSRSTANNATGIGGQPVVQPNGTVVVPIDNANETALLSFVSTDGGASWGGTVTVTAISSHTVAGSLRSGPLPSAEVDGAGRVYVVWQDSRFERGRANDIVMSTSSDGLTWSAVTRIPLDGVSSGVDHFIPGLAVDKATSGSTAHLGLTFYYYPTAKCNTSTCQLDIGFSSSADGGATWTAKTQLAGPMIVTWLPSTTQGYMVGDYISTSFSSGTSHPVFAVANAPSGGVFDEAMYSPAAGLTRAAVVPTAKADRPVVNGTSDHSPAATGVTHR